MLSNQAQRRHHTLICLAAVLIYHCFFFVVALLPNYAALYHSGFAALFVGLVVSLPCTLLLWRHYNHRYPFMPLGQFNVGYFSLGLLAIIVLNIAWQFLGIEEEWMASLKDYSLSARWGLAFAICFIAPFCEEVIFRGFLLNAFIRAGRFARQQSIVVTSVVFALMHTQYHAPATFIWLFTFSALLCVVRMASGGLLLPMLLHMLNNTASFSLSTMS
ncbi:CPBP family intramembrane glutamic endopeptidase [Phytobacter ursingii]